MSYGVQPYRERSTFMFFNKHFKFLVTGALLAMLLCVSAFAANVTITFMDGQNKIEERTVAQGTQTVVSDTKFKSGNVIFKDANQKSAEKYLIGWKEDDGTRLYKGAICPTENMTVYAVWADVPQKAATPGVNLFGSVDNYFGLYPSAGYLSVVKDEALNKDVVKYVRYVNGYQSVQIPVVWETGRKYKLSGKVRNDIAGNNASVVYNVRYYTSTVNTGFGDHGTGLTSQNGTAWRSFNTDFTFTEKDYVSNYFANFFSIYGNPYNNGAYDMYFSDLSLVPYYMVKFDANGGTGAPDFIQTLSDSADISSVTAVPTKAGHTFLGWGTSKTSKTPVTSVATGKDVTLYAIWERTDNDSCFLTFMDGDVVYNTYTSASGQKFTLNDTLFKNGNDVFTGWTAEGAEKYLVGWRTKESTQLYRSEFYPTSDMTLYAVWGDVPGTPAKSGVNLFGSVDNFYNLRGSGGYLTKVMDEALGKEVVKYVRYGNGYQSVQIPVMWEYGRKYKLSGSLRNDIDGNTKEAFYNLRYYTTDNQKYEGDHGKWLIAQKGETWRNFSADFTFDESFNADTANYVSNYYANFFSIYANPHTHDGTQSPAYNIYFSDLSLVPYYMVKFDANGGEGEPSPMQTLNSSLDISSVTETPAREGFTFCGWGLTEGAADAVTSVEFTEGDVTVYAIWQAISEQYKNVLSYSFATSKKGDAQGTINVALTDETTGYTTATIYYADDVGELCDYTALCTLDVTSGTASYTMPVGRIFPENVTRLCVVFGGEGKADVKYWYSIPENKKRDSGEKPKFTIYAVSDIHYGENVDDHPEATVNRNNALRDIRENAPDLVLANGDLINFGHEQRHYDATSHLFKTSFNDHNIPTLVSIGNHEYFNAASVAKDWMESSFSAFMKEQLDFTQGFGYEIDWDESKLFYSASKDGMRFIVLATPYPTGTPAQGGFALAVSDEQLKWLDEQLYKAEKSGEITFVMTHVPLNGYFPPNSGVGVYNKGISNTDAVKAVLNKHQNVFVSTAHTHSNLSLDYEWISIPSVTGEGFSHFNDGCTSWTSKPNGTGGSKNELGYGVGQYIEIYDDKVIFKARIFDDECKYVATGVYAIDIEHFDKNIGDVTMGGALCVGETLTALYDGALVNDDQTVQWFVNGAQVGTGKTFDVSQSHVGQKIALRVTNSDGTYASCLGEDKVTLPTVVDFGEEQNYKYTVKVNGGDGNGVIVVALYNDDGQMTDVRIVENTKADATVIVNTQAKFNVKVLVFDSMSTLKPLSQVQSASLVTQ